MAPLNTGVRCRRMANGLAVARYWTKAISDEPPGEVSRSQKWALARRGKLEVRSDCLKCGDWVLPYESISSLTLYSGWSLFLPVKVLEAVVNGRAYQFGLNGWVRIDKHLPTTLKRQPLSLKHSKFSIAVRLGVLALLAFEAWKWWRAGP